MARGGINKALVEQALEALLAKGTNPSIDAIRVELGNTGSKSTIHRYLRELEEEGARKLSDEASLSEPIKELVNRLALTLKEEAQVSIDESKDRADQEISTLNARIIELETALATTEHALAGSEQGLKHALNEIEIHKSTEAALNTQATQAAQAEVRLNSILEEKQAQIDSLEEKHKHNRDAMAHYRESVKEQRDQDQRNHAQQTQQLQAEMRTLNQTIALKQAELTELNKENGRLAAECAASQRTAVANEAAQRSIQQTLQAEVDQLTLTAESQQQQLSQMQADCADMDALSLSLAELQLDNTAKHTQLVKLEAEVAVKTEMIERLMSDKHQTEQAIAIAKLKSAEAQGIAGGGEPENSSDSTS